MTSDKLSDAGAEKTALPESPSGSSLGLFSPELFCEALRKLRFACIILGALIIFCQVVLVAANAAFSEAPADAIPEVFGPASIMAPLAFVPLIATPALMFMLFSAFYKRDASDFYLSLPYDRRTLSLSWTAAALAVSFIALMLGCALGYAAYALYPDLYLISTNGLVLELALHMAASAFSAACVLCAVSITGTTFAGVDVSLIIMYLPRYLMIILRYLIRFSNWMLSSTRFCTFLSFEQNALTSLLVRSVNAAVGASYDGETVIYKTWGPVVYTLLIAAILLLVGMVLFRRRKSEICYHSAASPRVQSAVRIAGGFAVSSLGTSFLLDQILQDMTLGSTLFLSGDWVDLTMTIIVWVMALIMYFAYELICSKTLRSMLRALPGVAAVVVLNGLFVVVAWAGASAATASLMDFSEIESVTVIGYDLMDSSETWAASLMQEVALRDTTALKLADKAIRESAEGSYSGQRQNALLQLSTDTGTKYINAYFSSSDYVALLGILAQNEEYQTLFKAPPEPLYTTVRSEFGPATYQAAAVSSDDSVAGLAQLFSLRTAKLRALREELSSMSASDLSAYLLADLTNSYDGTSGAALYIRYTEDSADLATRTIHVNPRYMPKTAELIFDEALKYHYGAEVLSWMLEVHDTYAAAGSAKTSGESTADTPEYGYFELYLNDYLQQQDGSYLVSNFSSYMNLSSVVETEVAVGDTDDSTIDGTDYEKTDATESAEISFTLNGESAWEILRAIEGTSEAPTLDRYLVAQFYGWYDDEYFEFTAILPVTEEAAKLIEIYNAAENAGVQTE